MSFLLGTTSEQRLKRLQVAVAAEANSTPLCAWLYAVCVVQMPPGFRLVQGHVAYIRPALLCHGILGGNVVCITPWSLVAAPTSDMASCTYRLHSESIHGYHLQERSSL